MASKFLKDNFKSMTKSEKEKLEELNEYRKLSKRRNKDLKKK